MVERRPYAGSERALGGSTVGEHDKIIALFKEGRSITQIGNAYGVTRARIQALLKRHGLNRFDGGMHVKALKRADAMAQERLAQRQKREDARGLPTGVRLCRSTGRYHAYIGRRHLGYFRTVEEALRCRQEAEANG